MTVTPLGFVSIGGSMAPLSTYLDAVDHAIATLTSAIHVAVSSLLTAKASIRLLALADLEVQLDAALAVTASISANISDPSAYLAGLVQGVLQVQANLTALVPTIALSAQLSASLAISAELTAKIAAFDLVLDGLLTINTALTAALSVVLDLHGPSLTVGAGLYLYAVSGAAATVAAELDAQLSGGLPSGAGGSANLNGLVLVTEDAATWTGMSAVFKVS